VAFLGGIPVITRFQTSRPKRQQDRTADLDAPHPNGGSLLRKSLHRKSLHRKSLRRSSWGVGSWGVGSWSCLALAVVTLSLSACGGSNRYTVLGSSRAAGTDGVIEVEKIEGTNVLVNINLEHLPPPNRIQGSKTTYVAWFQPRGAQPARAGALAYDEGSRVGNLMATTTQQHFRVIVTAEEAADSARPSEFIVAEQVVEAD